jgi:4-amino-4-deoxy-L-arabinose transferase-like glycosyltransferase
MASVSAPRLSLNHFSHEAWGALLRPGVVALAALLFFARLGARSLWHSELLWAEIAREMQLTHDYFWPAIIGRVYYDTPLVSYWLILAASWVTGRLNEAACRTPSALAALWPLGFLCCWCVASMTGDAQTSDRGCRRFR